jgi:hypothetical protein
MTASEVNQPLKRGDLVDREWPVVADFCLMHCNIIAPCTESTQQAANGKTRPDPVI